MAENKVEIKVTADTAQAVSGLAAVEGGIKRTGTGAQELSGSAGTAGKGLVQVGQGADVASAGLGKTRQGVQSISEQLSVAKTQIAAFISAQLGLGAVKSVAATADEYTNLQARIKLATGEGKNFTEAFDQVVGIAQRTSSSLVQTGTLFTRVAEAGKSAGLTTEAATAQSLRLTETINQAVQLSGGSAESSSAAVTQLIQGLQSGVLRGEEFNSVMEQAPRLAKALADGLGTTTGELRKMAEAGSLSSDVVIRALKGQSDTLKAEFATLPATVGRAIENLSTSWTLYIGDADKATGASATAASAIKLLADNLSTVAGYLVDAGQAAAGFGAVKLAQSFFGIATAAAQSGAAVVASTTATTGNTVAQQANALAVAQNSIAKQANVLTTSEQAAAKARAAGSTSLLTQATYVNTAGTTANTAAQVANALAVGKTGGAADAASAGIGRFSALLGTLKLFSLVGILTNVQDIGVAIGEGAAKLRGYKDRTEELARAEKVSATIAAEALALRERQTELNKAALDAQFALTLSARKSVDEFTKLTKEGTSAGEAIGKIGKDFDLASSPGIQNATAVLDELVSAGQLSAAQFQKAWADALKGADLAVFEVEARAALSGAAREAERLAQIMDATVREAIKRTGLDFEVISGGMGKASRSAINDTDAIVKGLEGLKKQGIDTGAVLTASIGKSINTADSAKAIEAVKAQIESLRKVLGDKVTDGLLDQATNKAKELTAAINGIKPGIQDVAEAMKTLGITSDAALKTTAKTSQEAYELMRQSGTNSARELGAAFAKSASDAIAANNGIAPSWVQAQAGARGYELAVDAAGKTTLRAMDDAAKSIDGLSKAAGGASQAVAGIGESAQASAADVEKMAAKIESINAKYGQGKADKEGKYDGPEYKSVTGNTREERLAGQAATDGSGAYALRTKQRDGTLGADDLKTAEAVYKAAVANKEIFDQNRSAFSLSAAQSILTEFNSARTILEQVRQAAAAQKQGQVAGQSAKADDANSKKEKQATSIQSSEANRAAGTNGLSAEEANQRRVGGATQTSNQTFTVKLDFGNGKTQNINVASANDAQTLISALQQAKAAAGF